MYGTDVKEMEYGTELKEGEMKFTCLGPEGNTDDKSHNVTTGNESSMILHLEYGEFDMLFTGDVEKEGEERLTEVLDVIQEEKKITWEILKTAHHGSKNSTTETFLQTVYPQYAWISAGRKNRYGHPHDLTLKRLEKSGAKIYSTQDNGAVAVTVRKKTMWIHGGKQLNLKSEFSILLRGEEDGREPMKTLNEDIKTGNFKPVYLLYGEEAYLKKQYRDRITKAIFPDGDTVNYAYYEGKGINPGELIDLAETMPFFADRRLIVIENSGFFKNASPELADYIKTMPDTACFLFVENEADKRGKMYKAVKSKGRVVEMARQDEKTLLYWVAGNVKKEGYKIKEQTARYLLSTTGTDMENLEKELEKLFCYCMGKEEIEVRDIEAICTTQITNKIFEMVEAVAVRNQKKALDYYYDLLALKEPPMRILYLLTRQFKLLLEVKDLAGKRYDKAAIAKTVGLHPFVAGKYMQQCRTFEKKELRSILEDAVDTEELVKTGRLNDVMSVELFIVKYSAA